MSLPAAEPAPVGWCCAALAEAVTLDCDRHTNGHDCPAVLVVPNYAEGGFGLPVRDGGTSFVTIDYCPWCGADIRAGGDAPAEPTSDTGFPDRLARALHDADCGCGDYDEAEDPRYIKAARAALVAAEAES